MRRCMHRKHKTLQIFTFSFNNAERTASMSLRRLANVHMNNYAYADYTNTSQSFEYQSQQEKITKNCQVLSRWPREACLVYNKLT